MLIPQRNFKASLINLRLNYASLLCFLLFLELPYPTNVINGLRQHYISCAGRHEPFPWCYNPINFNLEDIFTPSKIVRKEKTRGALTDHEISNVTGVFEAHPACEKPRTVFIEGDHGTGKLMLCQKIAHDWATEKDEWDESFPVIKVVLFLRCKDVNSDNIREAIDQQLLPEDDHDDDKDSFFTFIHENQSNVLLIFEGLDEAVPGKTGLYQKLVESRILPKCFIIFTSSHGSYEAKRKVRGVCDTLWEIGGFAEEHAEIFISKYFKEREHLAEKVISHLRPSGPFTNLRGLTKNPFLTAALCGVFEDSGNVLPTNSTRLYSEIILYALRRSESKRKKDSSPEEMKQDLYLFYRKELMSLGDLALEALLEKRCYFEERENSIKSFNFGLFSLRRGSKMNKLSVRCEFSHKRFQEFFAGFYLASRILNEEIDCASVLENERYSLKEMRQVFVFMSGIISSKCNQKTMSLISALIKKKSSLHRTHGGGAHEVRSYTQLAEECISECLIERNRESYV